MRVEFFPKTLDRGIHIKINQKYKINIGLGLFNPGDIWTIFLMYKQ